MRTGLLYLVSGPSGSGKTTLCRRLADDGEVHYATSCTTRQPREGEKDGHDYHFLSVEEFQAKVAAGDFLEHAEVHGNCYGTLKSEVLDHLDKGHDIVIDIDVQGAELIRSQSDPQIQKSLLDLFIMLDEEGLETRLANRGTDSQEVINLRLNNAREEIAHWPNYSHRMISADRETDYQNFKALLQGARLRTGLLPE